MNSVGLVEDTNPKIWNSAFIKIFIVNTVAQYCIYSMNTLSGPYANSLGAAATVVGLVSGIFGLTSLMFKFVSAPAIDAFKRKNVLIFALCILLVSFIGYAISHSVGMLVASRLLTGVGLAFVPTCCFALASDALPPEKMVTGISYYSLGTVICQAFAPAIGLRLVNISGYNTTFAILAGVMASSILFAFTMKSGYAPKNRFTINPHSIFAGEVLVPTTILFLLNMTFCNVNAFLVLYGEKQGVDSNHIGYFFTVLAATLIFTRPLIGKLADRYGSDRIIIVSIFFFAISFLLISLARTLPIFLLAGFVSAFGYAGCQPALMAVSMKLVPQERRGAASCTTYLGQDIGNLAGPVLAGYIVKTLGYVSMWQIMIFPILIAMLVSIVFRNRIDAPDQNFPQPGLATTQEEASVRPS